MTYNGDRSADIEAAPASSVEVKASQKRCPRKACIQMLASVGPSVPPGSSSDQVALGKKIFHGEVAGATCAGCHGADGIGTPVGADLSSGTWLWSDGSLPGLTKTIKEGVPEPKEHAGAMPPLGGVALVGQRRRRGRSLCLGDWTPEEGLGPY